ncbi:DMT family transporter [Brevibacillus ginsengisoli]|uniref:DMT family transporter n=1 Tax=Brevibacillus ginsengisoli TaxID=363854 RepID=UPI003CE8FD6B
MFGSRQRMLFADLSLLGIAISWGYTFVLAKDLLEEMSPLFFTGSRFLLAAILIGVWQWKKLKQLSRIYLRTGSIAGIFLCSAFTAQIFGIDMTTPGKAGVITSTSVVMVPFLYFVWSRTQIQKGPIIGCISAFIGLSLFSWDGSWQGVNPGDLLVLVCAVFFAIHTVYVDRTYEKELDLDPMLFTMVQLATVGGIDLIIALFVEPAPTPLSGYGWFAYLFELILGTLLAYMVQMQAQLYTTPIRVSLILSLESVFAFGFSWLIWGEPVTVSILFGVLLLLTGIYMTEFSSSAMTAKSAE